MSTPCIVHSNSSNFEVMENEELGRFLSDKFDSNASLEPVITKLSIATLIATTVSIVLSLSTIPTEPPHLGLEIDCRQAGVDCNGTKI